jgi:hypothetical protein
MHSVIVVPRFFNVLRSTYILSPYFSNVAAIEARIRLYLRTHARAHTHTYKYTHAHTHTHIQVHARTYTHTHFLRKKVFAKEVAGFPSGVDEVSILRGCDTASLGIFLGIW